MGLLLPQNHSFTPRYHAGLDWNGSREPTLPNTGLLYKGMFVLALFFFADYGRRKLLRTAKHFFYFSACFYDNRFGENRSKNNVNTQSFELL